MERFKQVLNEFSATELAGYMFRELSAYHINKLDKVIKLAQNMADEEDYEDKNVGDDPFAFAFESDPAVFAKTLKNTFEHGYTASSESVVLYPNIKKVIEIIDQEKKEWEECGSYVVFHINETDKTVKAIVRDAETGKVNCSGKAICHESDMYDPNIGKMIAIHKATYLDWKERLIAKGFKRLFI